MGSVGKAHSNRVEILEKVAENFESFDFYGYGIKNTRPGSILRKRYKGWANDEVKRKLFSSSKIAINLTLDGCDRVKRGVNARSFEIAACRGALQLCMYIKNMEEYFDGNEIVLFSNPDELVSKITYCLANDMERKEIVERSYKRNKENTYTNKVQKIIQVVA